MCGMVLSDRERYGRSAVQSLLLVGYRHSYSSDRRALGEVTYVSKNKTDSHRSALYLGLSENQYSGNRFQLDNLLAKFPDLISFSLCTSPPRSLCTYVLVFCPSASPHLSFPHPLLPSTPRFLDPRPGGTHHLLSAPRPANDLYPYPRGLGNVREESTE